MFFNANTKFSLHAPGGEDSMTVTGDRDRPGPSGTGGGANNGGGNKGSQSVDWVVMKPGDRHQTPWGTVIIDGEGRPTMNGIVMNNENSSWVDYGSGETRGSTRVLNSLLKDNPPTGGNNGGSTNKKNMLVGLPGHPDVADGGGLYGDNADKHRYYSRVGNNIYSVLVDRNGEIKGTFFESGNESGNRKAREEQKDKAWQQVWAYVNEKKQAEEKRKAEEEAKRKAAEDAARKEAEERARIQAQAEAELKARAEAEAKANAAAEGAKIGVAAAEGKVREAQDRINRATDQVNQKNSQLASTIPPRDEKQKLVSMLTEMYQLDPSYLGQLEEEEGKLKGLQQQVDALTAELNVAQQELNQANLDKRLADVGLDAARKAEADARAKAEADARAKAEAEAKLKELEEAKRKAAEAEKAKDEKEALTKASEIIADMGEKVGEYLGDKYKAVAKEIADDIKNFQGKTLRSYEQTMASLKKILDNPNMKVNKGDKDAIVNAWKSFKADDTAKKLTNLSKAFAVAGLALKIEKVREKSIEGYETGNWAPLILEVESWVLGGIAASVALGIFSATLGAFALSLGAPAVAVGIVGIIVAGTVAALIDDKVVDFLNNQVIRPAH